MSNTLAAADLGSELGNEHLLRGRPTVINSTDGGGRADSPVPSARGVARLAGVPADAITRIASDCTSAREIEGGLVTLLAFKRNFPSVSQAMSSDLFDLIPKIEEPTLRRQLLAIRRRLFGGYALSSVDHAAINVLPESVSASVRACARLNEMIRVSASAVKVAHDELIVRERRHLKSQLSNDNFQKGLLLASNALWESQSRYLSSDDEKLSSKIQHIEHGLLKYLLRASMKATPFGRFCVLARLQFHNAMETDSTALTFDSDPSAVRGFVRQNKAIYGFVWRAAKKDRETAARLPVRLNRTLRCNVIEASFLTSEGAIETFRRIQLTSVLSIIMEQVRSAKLATPRSLAETLVENPELDVTLEEAESYLLGLLDLGFLCFIEPAQDHSSDWMNDLYESLGAVPTAFASDVRRRISESNNYLSSYESAHTVARRSIAERFCQLWELPLTIGPEAKMSLPRNSFYEDASTSASLCIPDTPAVQSAIREFRDWCTLVRPICFTRIEQATMRHFFDKKVQASSVDRIDLLDFYEQYYREHMKEHLEAKSDLERNGYSSEEKQSIHNPFDLPYIDAIQRSRASIVALIQTAWRANPDAGQIHVRKDEIADILRARVPGLRQSSRRSVASFCQLVLPASDPTAALIICKYGAHSTGYGKYYSRFLHTLPHSVTLSVREGNASIDREHVLSEILLDGNFNANLHPALLGSSIMYPTSERQSQPGCLSVTDLLVRADPNDENALILEERSTGKRVVPVDLGIQALHARPALFQMLTTFAMAGSGLPLPQSHGGAEEAGESRPNRSRITHRPRIIFEDKVVLSRRRWSMPVEELPLQYSQETDAEYFVRVNVWRATGGIPSRVFFSVDGTYGAAQNRPASAESEGETNHVGEVHASANVQVQRRTDAVKPQFVNFASPLLVRMVSKLAKMHQHEMLHFEECLPEFEDLPRFNGKRYAYEMTIEVTLGDL
jgi:hypothetical protein